ncbi:MAG: hypothetical protein M1817_000796 [Caeruleum heppii]|nr:MAG: hypothetical protein M1817_000796 [Caeruleum heppii]
MARNGPGYGPYSRQHQHPPPPPLAPDFYGDSIPQSPGQDGYHGELGLRRGSGMLDASNSTARNEYMNEPVGPGSNPTHAGNRVARPQGEGFYVDNSNQQVPPLYQSVAQSPALSGYRHQYQAQSPPLPQTSYNPQEFASAPAAAPIPAQYHRQPSYPPPNGAYVPAQRPYNPAAYRDHGTPPQPPIPGYQSAYPTTYNVSPPVPQSAGGLAGLPASSIPQSYHYPQDQYPPTAGYFPPAPPPPIPPPSGSSPSYDPLGRQASQNSDRTSSRPSHSSSAIYPPPQRRLPSPPHYQHHIRPSRSSSPPKNDEGTPSNYSYSDSTPSPPLPRPPHHAPQRSETIGRHPQSRPLPGPPIESDDDSSAPPEDEDTYDEDDLTAEERAQDDIYQELEAAMMTTSTGRPIGPSSGFGASRSQDTGRNGVGRRRATNDREEAFPSHTHPRTNGYLAVSSAGQYPNDASSEDSDAEAAAGLAAMRVAEEQEAVDDARRGSGGYGQTFRPHDSPSRDEELSSDSDYANVDMELVGGGYEAHMSYGSGATPEHHVRRNDSGIGRTSNSNSMSRVPEARMPQGANYEDAYEIDYMMNAPYQTSARVDTFGTGGLADPTAVRRMSFDEGDEATWDRRSSDHSPASHDVPELWYYPATATGDRPLPPVPQGSGERIPQLMPAGTYRTTTQLPDAQGRGSYPAAPDAYSNQTLSPNGYPVPRSTSLTSSSSAPHPVAPARAKTDAEERRARFLKQQQLGIYPMTPGADDITSATPQSAATLDLPAIPTGKRKLFHPSKLSTQDFKRCTEPWALSSIAAWLRELSEEEADLKEKVIVDGIVALFTHKVPTMNIADAETLGARVVKEMFASGTLVKEEEWVKFGPERTSGVLWQLAGSGCYAPKVHTQEMQGRCYSHHCSRTLKKINLQTQSLAPQRKLEDWATFYKVRKEDVEGHSKKEVERQNNLHEIVQTEDQFMDQLDVLRILYRDQLLSWQPPIIHPTRLGKFAREVFDKVDAVKNVNEEYLLAQLKYRQQEQGPWIIGFSDIFREWIRKAKGPYTAYAASFPHATLMVRKEAEKNVLFRQFLDQVRENERSKRLGWDTYLKAPITRLQRYGLLLSTVHKNMVGDSDEKTNIQVAMDEIKAVTMECDARVAEMSKKSDLVELGSKLILRPGMERVELNLTHLGRELVFKGDLQRTGGNRFNWLEIHAMLFDHYFVLAKTVYHRDQPGGVKQERYDVSKLPIPMDLLVLVSSNDDPVVKSSVKGIAAVSTGARTQTPVEARLGRTTSAQSTGPGTLTHSSTNSSMVTNTVLDGPKDEKVMYPFRVKHLGQDVYTLYAPSAANRQDWCDKILEAKTKHAASLFAQNAEPFRLRVQADSAFQYDASVGSPRNAIIKGTPLERAVREVESTLQSDGARPNPVARAYVNCATSFIQPYGQPMVAVGTSDGVFITETQNPRGWRRAITIAHVTQIVVLEEFSLLVLIAEKSLIAYHLDAVCPVGGGPPGNDSARRAPQKLSGTREVGFFATGRMKDRTLVFYKKREGLSSTFKVLEPVFQKSTERRSRFHRKGTTEFFRDFDEFYIPTECFGISLFHSSLAISTSKGFEVLTLDKKTGWAVPDLKSGHVASIAARLASQKPLGMFRLNDAEFLLCYEECAVYVNKHGDVSRSVIMEFVGKAKSAAMYGPYVLLFDPDFVEVRNAENGRLRQVISGRDVRCLDDARGGGQAVGQGLPGQRSVKVALQHPEMERMQLVVELVLNEGQLD